MTVKKIGTSALCRNRLQKSCGRAGVLTPVKTARAKIPPQAITVKINYSAFFEVRRCNYFKEEPVNMAINLEMLQEKAKDVRIDIIRQIHSAGSGHPGGSLSAADIITYLYFAEMNIDPQDPA